jgi:type II secretory pathway pseudopilin PulG
MKYHSKKILFYPSTCPTERKRSRKPRQRWTCLAVAKRRRMSAPAFSLVEVVTALIILALISSSVLVVINRCMASAADSELRMQAFEVACDNMESLLSKDSVEEMVEYGNSDKYPEIKWQTTVEIFYEPTMMEQTQIWVRGICSAEYADTTGQTQTIELTNWLTGLTREQLLQMLKQKLSEPNEPNSLNKSSEPNEPNRPSEPNAPKAEPNKPEPESEPNRPATEPKADCDTLPFCESVICHLEAGTSDRMTLEELVRYLNECP